MAEVPPSINCRSFNCPHCGAFSHQNWYHLCAVKFLSDSTPLEYLDDELENCPDWEYNENRDEQFCETNIILNSNYDFDSNKIISRNSFLSECISCKHVCIWVGEKLIFPANGISVKPNEYMPDFMIDDFVEAAKIANISPRGSAALARLCIQNLCKHLGEDGKTIFRDITSLADKGLDEATVKALDVIRLAGNDSVHPDSIGIASDTKTALDFLRIVNLIVEKTIASTKRVEEIYSQFSESQRIVK